MSAHRSRIGWLVHTLLSAQGAARWLFLRKQLAGDDADDAAGAREGARSRRAAHAPPRARQEADAEPRKPTTSPATRTKRKRTTSRSPRANRACRCSQPQAREGGFLLPPLTSACRAEAQRPSPAQHRGDRGDAPRRWKACWRISACKGEIINARPGPVVTLYELEPAPGIKSSRVIGLADDIARSMSAMSARVAVVPGRNAIGIELPNEIREKVYLREMLAASEYNRYAGQAAALSRQDHRRRAGGGRSCAHAAPADRRHHRLGQVGRDQHHDPVACSTSCGRISAA